MVILAVFGFDPAAAAYFTAERPSNLHARGVQRTDEDQCQNYEILAGTHWHRLHEVICQRGIILLSSNHPSLSSPLPSRTHEFLKHNHPVIENHRTAARDRFLGMSQEIIIRPPNNHKKSNGVGRSWAAAGVRKRQYDEYMMSGDACNGLMALLMIC